MLKVLTLLVLITSFTQQVIATPKHIQQAIEQIKRPPEDKLKDQQRKPDKVLTFFDVRPGMQVLDLFSGGGYYTELLSHVVKESGQVYAHNNKAYIDYIGTEKLQKRYHQRLPNVQQYIIEANALNLPVATYDRILMILTFHDLYYTDEKQGWPEIDADKLMKKVYLSLKPGGVIGIVDHAATKSTGVEVANSLHRISPQLIKKKMQAWGFVFVDEAKFLHNPEDPLTVPMWDPKIRGKTHRAVMKFSR